MGDMLIHVIFAAVYSCGMSGAGTPDVSCPAFHLTFHDCNSLIGQPVKFKHNRIIINEALLKCTQPDYLAAVKIYLRRSNDQDLYIRLPRITRCGNGLHVDQERNRRGFTLPFVPVAVAIHRKENSVNIAVHRCQSCRCNCR